MGNILYSVFTTRIVLNIQDVGNRGQQTELHTIYHEAEASALPLQFMTTSEDNEGRSSHDLEDHTVTNGAYATARVS